MKPFYAYEENKECETCNYSKQVIAKDYAVYIICFKPYDKSRIFGDEPCVYHEEKI